MENKAFRATGTRNRRAILTDAFKLITYRQKDQGRKLTGKEKARLIRQEFEQEAKRIFSARYPRQTGKPWTPAESRPVVLEQIVRDLMAGRRVLPGLQGQASCAANPKG